MNNMIQKMLGNQSEVAKLRQELEDARARVAYLDGMLRPARLMPQCLGLGRTHDRLASFIFRASPRTVSLEAILSGSWGVDNQCRNLNTLRVQISKMRPKLRAYNISIVSHPAIGYCMPMESAKIVKAMLAQEADMAKLAGAIDA